MKQFFKTVFASLLGTLLAFLVSFFIFLGIIIALIASAGDDEPETISEKSILRIDLGYAIPERTLKEPFSDFDFASFEDNKHLGLKEILAAIHQAKTDPKITGIYLPVSAIPAGFANLEEIRDALIDFKSSKKFIIAFGEVVTQSGYYIASVADKFYLYPEGLLEFRGLSSEVTFIKGALEKLEIEPQIIKVGTFKSAVEPLFLDKMSEANRKQVTVYLGSLYDHYLGEIASSRKIAKNSLFAIANKLQVQEPKQAVDLKLADGTRYYDEVQDELRTLSGIEAKKSLRWVNIADYALEAAADTADNKLAVIYANGDIESGEGDDESIGSDRIAEAIRKARNDEKVKAIVLRVNSPGGSALASDVIWREMVLAKEAKPVVVSMGNVAASGGYYIACAADKIFAQPNTITGSIGVFGVLPNAQKFFNNKLGITFDGVKTGEYADLGSINRPLTEQERAIIQNNVNNTYKNFIEKVAKGRKMTPAQVDSIGQGRVWSGTDALKIGLVDQLGSIQDAIDAAATMAKLNSYKTVNYPDLKDPLRELMSNFGSSARTWMIKQELGDQYRSYEQIKKVMKIKGVQARMEYDLDIH